jgi:uncharacterized membrane protein YfcA
MDIWIYLLAMLGGAFAGAINTLAGNGSAVTLTILTELLGLPPNMANGTNRIGICAQTLVGTYIFHKNGHLTLNGKSWTIIILTSIGAIGGVITATQVSNEEFRQVFRFLMIVMLFVILINPKRWLRDTDPSKSINWWIYVPVYLAIGFYGGFIQMGMGIFFLAALVLGAHYSLIDGNGIKLFVVGLYTLFVLAIFQYNGLIDWKIGAIMAVGQTTGAWLTAVFATRHPKANVWAHRLLILVVVLAIGKLFGVFG